MKVSGDLQYRCHEANQIYTLVEVDAERQANEKTEFIVRERLPIRRKVSGGEYDRHTDNKQRQF